MNSQTAALAGSRAKGIVLVLIAAVFWGVSGTVAQYLFHRQGFSPSWLVVIRMLISGMAMLFIAHFGFKQNIWSIWTIKSNIGQLFIFGIAGMLAVQYTYFAAIEYGNAATATVLQYVAPVLIASYFCLRLRRLPAKHETSAIMLAVIGTFMLVTKGNFGSLSISAPAFIWGILSAFALAFYTLYPSGLLARWGSLITVGWGMLIGGAGLSFIHPPWDFQGQWSLSSLLAVAFVVICGTLIAFFCYMESMKYISASEASLLACFEPLSAALLAVVWLQVSFNLAEWLGALSIIATIVILSAARK